jgi:hypothetical protein
MLGYKILHPDNCSPIKTDKSLFSVDAKLPLMLPKVPLDTSDKECGAGWNFCSTVKDAIDIAKLFSIKGVNRIYKVQGSSDSIKRGLKIRCSELTIISPIGVDDFVNCEPNGKEKELFDWLVYDRKFDERLILKYLNETLKIKGMDDWKIIIYNNNYYNDYYYNNNNYYHYNHYNNYYYYYYVLESLFEPNQQFKQLLIQAYKAGMLQLKFNNYEKHLIVWSDLNPNNK